MCITAIIHLSKTIRVECTTQGELAAAMGGLNRLVYLPGEKPDDCGCEYDPCLCLCSINMRATAELGGYEYVPPPYYIEDGEPDVWSGHFIPRPGRTGTGPRSN